VSWEQLDLEIGEMFAEYSWHANAMERAIEINVAARRASEKLRRQDPWYKREQKRRHKIWCANNPSEARRHDREYRRRWVAKDPTAARETWRRRKAENRDRKRAAGILPPNKHRCGACGSQGHNARTCQQQRSAA
jgi:hypothetical protein